MNKIVMIPATCSDSLSEKAITQKGKDVEYVIGAEGTFIDRVF